MEARSITGEVSARRSGSELEIYWIVEPGASVIPTRYEHLSLSQDLETGCPKSAISKFLSVLSLKGHPNKLRLQP